MKRFASDIEVPDLCPVELLLPNEPKYLELSIPRENGNVSPVEVSWILLNDELPAPYGWHSVKFSLRTAHEFGGIERIHEEIRISDYMNHCIRVAARIALDPRRTLRFDFAEAYTLDRGKVFPRNDEREFFTHFHDTFGVVER